MRVTNHQRKTKQRGGDPFRLSGTINGVKYRLGVANPYNRRQLVILGPRHLQALRLLLQWVDPACLETTFVIDEAEFARRFSKNALLLLKTLITCWVRTRSTAGTIVVARFAAVSFYEDPQAKTILITFSATIVPVLKGLIVASKSPDTTDHP